MRSIAIWMLAFGLAAVVGWNVTLASLSNECKWADHGPSFTLQSKKTRCSGSAEGGMGASNCPCMTWGMVRVTSASGSGCSDGSFF